MYEQAYHTAETSPVPSTLIRSGVCVTRKVTLPAGAVYASGSVLGIVTVGGKAVLSAAAANDGSQTPAFVLSYNVSTMAGSDVEAIAVERGDLVGSQMVLGAGHTLASIRDGLRAKGITFSVATGS